MAKSRTGNSAAPRIDRPGIPASYGASKASEFVDWSHIEDRLVRDRVYWIATVGETGHPRVRPIDGVYLDNVLYVGGSPETRWVREVATNPHVSVHLDGVDDVIIVEGIADVVTAMPEDAAQRLATASNAKFPEYGVTAELYMTRGAIAIRPRKVISWTDIAKNPTRFRFGS